MPEPRSAEVGHERHSLTRLDRHVTLPVLGAVPALFLFVVAVLPLLVFLLALLGLVPSSGSVGRTEASIPLTASDVASLLRSLAFSAVAPLLQMALALFAVRLTVPRLSSGSRVVAPLLLIPLSLTPVAVGLLWRSVFDYGLGPIDAGLRALRLEPVPWLSTFPVRYPPVQIGFSEVSWGQLSVLIVDTWTWTPFLVGVLLVVFNRVPASYVDVARLEGASSGQVFWRVLVPASLPYLFLLYVLRCLDAYRSFDVVWAFFGSQVSAAHLSSRIYTKAFVSREYHAAMALTFLGVAAALPLAFLLLSRARRILEEISVGEPSQ